MNSGEPIQSLDHPRADLVCGVVSAGESESRPAGVGIGAVIDGVHQHHPGVFVLGLKRHCGVAEFVLAFKEAIHPTPLYLRKDARLVPVDGDVLRDLHARKGIRTPASEKAQVVV